VAGHCLKYYNNRNYVQNWASASDKFDPRRRNLLRRR
jgi:hypothetical protein